MKKFFAVFLLIFVLTACDKVYCFFLQNDSEFNLYIIVDTCTQDNDITLGSYYRRVPANSEVRVDSKNPWEERIKDYAYIYVLDADKISFLHQLGTVSREEKKLIAPDVILDSIVIYHSGVEKHEIVVWP